MRSTKIMLGLALIAGFAAAPALALDLSNAGLQNLTIGTGGNVTSGNANLNNSSSISGSTIGATTTSTTTFGNGVNQNPAGNSGIGGVSTGFAETTALKAGGEAIANTNLNGNGSISGNYNNTQTQNGGGSTFNTTSNLNANGTLNGSFVRTANSNAATGLNGYSGSQMTGGPGTVSNTVVGSAFGAGASLSGGSSLRQ
jgi:hypothetical protein